MLVVSHPFCLAASILHRARSPAVLGSSGAAKEPQKQSSRSPMLLVTRFRTDREVELAGGSGVAVVGGSGGAEG